MRPTLPISRSATLPSAQRSRSRGTGSSCLLRSSEKSSAIRSAQRRIVLGNREATGNTRTIPPPSVALADRGQPGGSRREAGLLQNLAGLGLEDRQAVPREDEVVQFCLFDGRQCPLLGFFR